MYSGKIKLRSGVDTYGAQPPDGLPFRTAVLTWVEVGGESVDPWPLMRSTVPSIATAMSAENVLAEYWRRVRKGISRRKEDRKLREVPWQDLMSKTDEALMDDEFPSRILFMKDGEVVIAEESEMWSMIGGPAPYHDSVTLSFFSAKDEGTILARIFTAEARRLGFEIDENIQDANRRMEPTS